MDTLTAPATRSYEVAVQREMLGMAARIGALTAELRLARITLNALLPSLKKGWEKDEIRELVDRIDLALSSAKDGVPLGSKVLP